MNIIRTLQARARPIECFTDRVGDVWAAQVYGCEDCPYRINGAYEGCALLAGESDDPLSFCPGLPEYVDDMGLRDDDD